ncbi:MAG TPA: hypothetical protein VMZ30_08905 [Pyrinomonadaceae bacterium]|nr:hypothetical protein [Pyrinomonadaceae bacterium]
MERFFRIDEREAAIPAEVYFTRIQFQLSTALWAVHLRHDDILAGMIQSNALPLRLSPSCGPTIQNQEPATRSIVYTLRKQKTGYFQAINTGSQTRSLRSRFGLVCWATALFSELTDCFLELCSVGILLELDYLPITKAEEVRELCPNVLAVLFVSATVITMPDYSISGVKHFFWSNSKSVPLVPIRMNTPSNTELGPT